MSNTITFRELVKKIHPDHNPNIPNAGEKMRSAVLNKNNPEALYRLGVQWGVITVTTTTSTPNQNLNVWNTGLGTPPPNYTTSSRPTSRPTRPVQPRYRWETVRCYHPEVGDIVAIRTKEWSRVRVVKVTRNRVYFHWFGRLTYAFKKNVFVQRKVRVR